VKGLDYADRRWYAQGQGRFLTSDPYQASGGPGDPASWNRYSYVQGDPNNYADPSGLARMECNFTRAGCTASDWEAASWDMSGVGGPSGCAMSWTGSPNLAYCYVPPIYAGPSPPDDPTCTITLFMRPIANPIAGAVGGVHTYVMFEDEAGERTFVEGANVNGTLLVITSGVPSGNDHPERDQTVGSRSGREVCDWLTFMRPRIRDVNQARLPYPAFGIGPNSNTVLRYILDALPTQRWYRVQPQMIASGWFRRLPKLED
jgi:RHS repeat-associated protein